MTPGRSQYNYRLAMAYRISQYTPLYWPYMYHYVTATLGLSAADFGLLKGIYYFTVVLAEVPFGVVADRWSRRSALVGGALANTLACLVYAAGDDFAALAAAEVCFGVGTALVSGAGSALLYDSFGLDGRTAEYPRHEGRVGAAGLLATTLGLPATDWLLIQHDDATLAYTATAAIAALGVVAAAVMSEPRAPSGEPGVTARNIGRGAIREVRRSAAIRGLLLYSAAVFVLMRAANALVFDPVMSAGGVPVHFWGTTVSAVGLVGAWASWRSDYALKRWGEARVRAALPAAMVAMYAGLAVTSTPAVAAILSANGLALGALPVVVLAGLNPLVSDSRRRATVLSLESMFSRAAYGLTAIGVGALLDRVALDTVLWGCAAAGAAPAAYALLAIRLKGTSPGSNS